MVTVLAVADEEALGLTPAQLSRIAPDIVLGAGDLGWEYLEYLASATDVPLVFVPGNHDPAEVGGRHTRSGLWVSHGVVTDGPRPRGGVNADGLVVEAAGLRIAGLGGCVRYNDGPHQYSQGQYARRVRRLVRRAQRGRSGPSAAHVDVLLTHAPPYGLGDLDDRCHTGIEALHLALAELRPAVHVHGHIHPYGQATPDRTVGPTTIRNVIPYATFELHPAPVESGAV